MLRGEHGSVSVATGGSVGAPGLLGAGGLLPSSTVIASHGLSKAGDIVRGGCLGSTRATQRPPTLCC